VLGLDFEQEHTEKTENKSLFPPFAPVQNPWRIELLLSAPLPSSVATVDGGRVRASKIFLHSGAPKLKLTRREDLPNAVAANVCTSLVIL
jgi:hypothetical protein